MLTVNAHDADVNVLSWNRQTTFMMASGADDGSLRAWDLRSFTMGATWQTFPTIGTWFAIWHALVLLVVHLLICAFLYAYVYISACPSQAGSDER